MNFAVLCVDVCTMTRVPLVDVAITSPEKRIVVKNKYENFCSEMIVKALFG